MTYHREMRVTKDMRIAELEAEVAALLKDAERYRYLRSCAIDDHIDVAELERGIDEARKA